MKTLTIEFTGPVMALLRQLHRTGLYGLTVEETAERIICEDLRRRIREDEMRLTLRKTNGRGSKR